ncbi:MAG: hypothetical protein Q8M65_06520 [Rhodoglobus sp.]|nr:hypothetical protein [Rhodoglobus sp.]
MSEEATRPEGRPRYGWMGLAVAILFALFYAYDVWEAVSNLVALPAFYDAYGFGAENVPWWLLWIGVLLPLLAYAVAFAGGRHCTVVGRATVFLVGLAATAGLSLGVLALEEIVRPMLLVAS